jgi:D-amino-acid dehydrogenase
VRIVVVGAGVVGLACAYELLQDGHDVLVLDGSAAGQGVSLGNAAKIAVAEAGPVPAPGMVLQGLRWMLRSDSPLYVKPSLSPPFLRFMLQMARSCTEAQFRAGLAVNLGLAESANDLFDEWQDSGLDFEMHRRGVVLAYQDVRHFEHRLRYQDVFSAYGAEPQVLDPSGLREVEPALGDRVRRGLFYPSDRQVEPASLNAALVGHIGKLGGTLSEHAEVAGFETGPRGVTSVRTGDGRSHRCDGVVLAAGVWTMPLAARLGLALPVAPGKGYSIDYTPAPIDLRTSLTLEEAHVAVTPLDGMLRIAGTMEFAGLSDAVRPHRVAAIQRAAAEAFRDWRPAAAHREPWAGLRPMTPDGIPVIGPLADGANVWVATGHAMLGLTLAPTTGRIIRELVRGDRRPEPATSPQRFTRPRRRRRRLSAILGGGKGSR